MDFNEHVKKWVTLDNHIQQLNTKIKELKQNRISEENIIFNYVETNNLNNAIVEISDGKLRFSSVKQTSPLTFKLVEDCCEATGATKNNIKIGNFGECGSFSFYFGHHMTTIEGGMVCTNNRPLHNILLLKRSHGLARELSPEYFEIPIIAPLALFFSSSDISFPRLIISSFSFVQM